jgi:putative hydrolases of HD superfamily
MTQEPSCPNRLESQIRFCLEIDKLTAILRRTLLLDGSRLENSAEHSWHIAIMAILLAEYSAEPGIDLARVIKMVLVHDLVEIDAGDTYCYDVQGNLDKAEREQRAADRIFGLLPADQGAEVRALWEEFEARATPESRYANSMDRLQPMLHNYHTQGRQWRKHGITSKQVLERNAPIGDGAPALWAYARRLVDDALANGYLES